MTEFLRMPARKSPKGGQNVCRGVKSRVTVDFGAARGKKGHKFTSSLGFVLCGISMFSLRQRGFPPGALKVSTRGHLATLKLPNR